MFNFLTFVGAEKVDFSRHIERVARELADVPWCLAFGSALGAYRDNGHVPGDTDIDVMILADDLAESPMSIAARFFDDYNLARTVTHDGKYHQIALQSTDHFIVDLCFFYGDGDDLVSRCEDGHWRDEKAVIGEFGSVTTKFGTFPIPEQIETYLESRYGDWRTPRYGEVCCSRKDA